MLDVQPAARSEFRTHTGLVDWMRKHPVMTYFTLMYLVTWLVFVPGIFGKSGLGVLNIAIPTRLVTSLASILGLTLTSVFMTSLLNGAVGVRHLLQRFVTWRVGLEWYLAALFGAPTLFLIGATTLLGSKPVGIFLRQGMAGLTGYLGSLMSGSLLINLWEEAGLMGFPFLLLQRRLGPVKASLILGPLWALMHSPALFLPGAVAPHPMPLPQMLTFMVFLMIVSLPIRIILTWLFNETKGSFLFVGLFHGGFDLTMGAISKLVPSFNPFEYLIVCAVFAVGLIVVTRGKLGYQPPHPAAAE